MQILTLKQAKLALKLAHKFLGNPTYINRRGNSRHVKYIGGPIKKMEQLSKLFKKAGIPHTYKPSHPHPKWQFYHFSATFHFHVPLEAKNLRPRKSKVEAAAVRADNRATRWYRSLTHGQKLMYRKLHSRMCQVCKNL